MRIRELLMVVVAVLIFATATLFTSGAKVEGGKASLIRASARPQASASNGVLRVWIHGEEIYPDHARINPGTVMLVAENQTSSDITLVVERVEPGLAPRLASTVSAAGHVSRASRTLTLASGQYVFYEQSRPEIRGKLIVE